jgi:DNA-binding FadR family transcriptional regulator
MGTVNHLVITKVGRCYRACDPGYAWPVPTDQPAHERIVETLREEILRGEPPPGSAMPTYSALEKRFATGRPTVWRAIDTLREEGLLEAAGTGPRSGLRVVADLREALKRRIASAEREADELRVRLAQLDDAASEGNSN